MRILITGGFGFVGGRVARHLQRVGHQVVLGSRSEPGPPDWLPQADVVRTDWNDGPSLGKICAGIDVVIHAAGMNAQDCLVDPVAALDLNGTATARIVGESCRAGVSRFFYISTAHVYGSPLEGSIDEGTCPGNLHPYATSHLAGEHAVLGRIQRGEIEGLVLRMSNIFGAPVHSNTNCWMLVANDLCRQAVVSGEMVLRTNGLQSRDFISMADVCMIIENLVSRNTEFGLPAVVNVGSGKSSTVLEMARSIQRRCRFVLGFEPKLHTQEGKAGEQHEILQYRVKRLAKLGVELAPDQDAEIDSLLVFCRAAFNRNQDFCA